ENSSPLTSGITPNDKKRSEPRSRITDKTGNNPQRESQAGRGVLGSLRNQAITLRTQVNEAVRPRVAAATMVTAGGRSGAERGGACVLHPNPHTFRIRGGTPPLA